MHRIRRLCTVLIPAITLIAAGCGTVSRQGEPFGKYQAPSSAAGELSFEERVEAGARFAAGVAFELREEPDRALEEYYQAALADWINEPFVSDVGRRLLAAKQPVKAVEVLAKCAARAESTAPVHALLGFAYVEAGQKTKAIAANQVAIRKQPDYLPAYQNLLQVHLSDKKPAEARKVLEAAMKAVTSDRPESQLGLAETHNFYLRANPGDAEELRPRVIGLLDKVSESKPTAPPLIARLAEAYFFSGEFGKAATLFLDLLNRAPNLPGLRERLIDAYVRNQDWKQASEQLEAVVRANPANANAYLVLSGIAYEEKQFERAAEYLEKALLFRPDLEQAYYDLAGLKINTNKAQEALDLLDRARLQFKNKFLLEFYTGLAYSQLKQYPKALKFFTAAEVIAGATEPQRLNQFFYFQLGVTHERSKDFEQAERYFLKCIEMQPDNADALNYLGYMWAERGVKLPEAKKMIEQAVKIEPENGAFLDSMAWVLYQLKDYRAALEWQLKALKHNEEPDATLFDHLGDIYAALKQMDKAREYWKKSLEVEPSEAVSKKLEGAPAAPSK